MPSSSASLGAQMLRTASIFQGIAALIAVVGLVGWVIDLFYTVSSINHLYDDVTAICTTLLATAILFSVLVQRNPNNTRFSTMCLEIVKASCASALWIWLLLDSIFAKHYGYREDFRSRRVTLASVSVLILLVGYYPTLIYSYFDYKGSLSNSFADDEQNEGERAPLLRA